VVDYPMKMFVTNLKALKLEQRKKRIENGYMEVRSGWVCIPIR